jgi:hypothetical protein
MQSRQGFAYRRAVAGIRSPNPQSIKKGDDRCRPPGDLAEHATLLVLYRLRTINIARRQMLHQTQEEWEITFGNTLFIQRQNEITGAVDQEIGISTPSAMPL